MAKAKDVVPEPFVERPFITWDKWLRNIMDDISEFPDNDSRLRRALGLQRELESQLDFCQITQDHYELGSILIDAVLRGWYGRQAGVRCVGVSDCDEECPNHEECARYETWARMYPGAGMKDSRVRICSYLAIHVPQFTEKVAKKLGIHDQEAF